MKDDVDDETSEKRKDTDGQAPPSTDTCNLRTRLQLYVCKTATLCVQRCNPMYVYPHAVVHEAPVPAVPHAERAR